MGCCFSRSEGPNSPYPGPGATEIDARATGAQAGENPAGANTSSGRRGRGDPSPLAQNLTKPLRRHTWIATDRTWTRGELAREREEFFDTRVSGRPEIWQAIHIALQVLWETVASENPDDAATGLATAQSLLDASEILLPTGNLFNGAYDSRGYLYLLPEHVISDPDNVLSDEDKKQQLSGTGDDQTLDEDEDEDSDEDDDDDDDSDNGDEGAADEDRNDETGNDDNPDAVVAVDGAGGERTHKRKKEKKGKGPDERAETIQLRARLSDSCKDILVPIKASEKLRSVIAKIAVKAGTAPEKHIRIAYLGKMLKENASLEAQGWKPGHVVNAMIFPPKPKPPAP